MRTLSRFCPALSDFGDRILPLFREKFDPSSKLEARKRPLFVSPLSAPARSAGAFKVEPDSGEASREN